MSYIFGFTKVETGGTSNVVVKNPPVNNSDIATKGYVDDSVEVKDPPTADTDIASKKYVDANGGGGGGITQSGVWHYSSVGGAPVGLGYAWCPATVTRSSVVTLLAHSFDADQTFNFPVTKTYTLEMAPASGSGLSIAGRNFTLTLNGKITIGTGSEAVQVYPFNEKLDIAALLSNGEPDPVIAWIESWNTGANESAISYTVS